MEGLFFGVGAAIGMVFATVCMIIAWTYDVKDERIRLKKVQKQAYEDGFQKGTIWKYRQMIAAERELEKVQAEIEELKESR